MKKKKTKIRTSKPPVAGITEKAPPDIGTPEFAAQCGDSLISYETSKGARRRNIVQVPIDYYRFAVKTTCPTTGKKIPTITAAQHQAGERLHVHFQQSGMVPSSFPTTDLAAIGSGSSGDRVPSDRQNHHRQQLRRAIAAIKSDSGKVVAVNVCCYGYLLKDIALPYHSGAVTLMPILKESLDDLIRFFGIPSTYDSI